MAQAAANLVSLERDLVAQKSDGVRCIIKLTSNKRMIWPTMRSWLSI